jgi:DNA-binding phage protein
MRQAIFKGKHWTDEKEEYLQERIAQDFLAQIEDRLSEKKWGHVDLAKALGITEGRISQVFNDPGNLTLKTMVRMAKAVGLMVSVVAYNMKGKEREAGPVVSWMFESCWEKLGEPMAIWDLETPDIYYSGE